MPISKVNRKGIASDAQNYTIDTFTGDGSTVAFTLSQDPVSNTDLIVSVGGVLQAPTTNYTLSGTTLTFTGAPDATIPIMVTHLTYRNGAKEFTPDDGSVTSSKLAANIDIAGTLDVTGNMTAGGTLDVTGNISTNKLTSSDTAATIVINDTDGVAGASTSASMRLQASGTEVGTVGFQSSGGVMNVRNRKGDLFVQADSDNEASNSKILFQIDGSEVARLQEYGLSFDTGSNYLDDYEQGTFEVKINVNGSDSSTSTTCRYVKIGRMVMIEMIDDNSTNPYFLDSSSGVAGQPVRISTASGFGQLPFVPVSTGQGIMGFTRGIRSEDDDNAAGQTFAWGWLKNSAQLYVGRVTSDGNEYNIYDGNVSNDTNVTLEKNQSVSNVVLSAQFVYYTDA